MIKLKSFGALLGALLFTAAAIAADPTGTWTWSTTRNGQSRTTTLKLELKGDALSGSVSGRNGDTPISDASFGKDGAVAFSVKREFNGNSFVIKYAGKLDGDTIKGTTQTPGRDGGEPRTTDWTATRKAADKPADAAPKS